MLAVAEINNAAAGESRAFEHPYHRIVTVMSINSEAAYAVLCAIFFQISDYGVADTHAAVSPRHAEAVKSDIRPVGQPCALKYVFV